MKSEMMNVKEYAELRGKSVQAVHQQIKRKTNAKALKRHIFTYKVNNKNVKFIDKEGIEILDDSSKQTLGNDPETSNEIIEQLRIEKEQLLLEVAMQADEIAELAKWKADNALALAEIKNQKLLLEEKKEELDKVKIEAAQRVQESNQRAFAAEEERDTLKERLENITHMDLFDESIKKRGWMCLDPAKQEAFNRKRRAEEKATEEFLQKLVSEKTFKEKIKLLFR